MSIIAFGEDLLRTQDLDPVYVAIYKAKLDYPTRQRLCLAYWCFYHLGFAAQLAEQKTPKKFWALFLKGVLNASNPDGSKPYPRGAERRHFRGANALATYADLTSRYRTPEEAAKGLVGVLPLTRDAVPVVSPTFSYVSASVQKHVGFGPWIAFKIADMAERLLDCRFDMRDCSLGIYKDPRQGAAVAFLEAATHLCDSQPEHVNAQRMWEYPITDAELAKTVDYYVALFRQKGYKAGLYRNRPVNVQEIETIFCKYKSHLKGHYPLGKDTREVSHGLDGWGDLAQQLKYGLPGAPLQGRLL